MRRRIVVTGLGVCFPIGTDIEAFSRSLAGGVCGIRETTDVFPGESIWAGLVSDQELSRYLPPTEAQEFDRAAQLAIVAAEQAMADAGIGSDRQATAPERIGLVVGTGHGGRTQLDRYVESDSGERDPSASRRLMLAMPAHQQTYAVVCRLGIHGPAITVSNACSSSGTAIGYAYELLQAGRVDIALAGGVDAFSKVSYAGFRSLGALAEGPCAPFSDRIGVSLGEGAGFVVLETLEHARARNASIRAELLSYSVTSDAFHLTEPEPSGDGVFRAISGAVRTAGIEADAIDYVNAHGTGTRANDASESLALRRFFPEAKQTALAVSATKSFTGHTLGAASVLGFIVCITGMERGFFPPTLNFQAPRPGCNLDYVPNQARPGKIRYFLSNSAGFGGVNTVLVGGRLSTERRLPERHVDLVGITGVGIVSSLGCGLEPFLEGLRQGRSGIAPIDRFDTASCRATCAGLVRDFAPRRLLPTVDVRRMDPVMQYAVVASGQALEDACLSPRRSSPERIGLVVGTTRGAITSYEKFLEGVRGGNWHQASPVYFPNLSATSIAGQVTRVLGLKGFSSTIVDGIGAGLQALLHGFEILRQNDALDALVVVAADEVGALYFHHADCLQLLATPDSPGGERLAPYAANAPGLVLGEGAVAFLLERLGSARARHAHLYARLAGYGLLADAVSYQGMEPQGHWLTRAMELALAEAELEPHDLDLIYGHGRGVPSYDQREVRAIERLLEGRRVPVGCVMGNTGVAEASCGLFSVAAAVLGMERGEAYPMVSEGAVGEELAFVREEVRVGTYRRVLVAGSTENGNNAALVLERRSDE